jgi:hypothetical protein
MKSRLGTLFFLVSLLAGPTGCQHYGPRSIAADRIPYNESIALSWKEQTLLNIVKIRYMGTPFFLDVPPLAEPIAGFQGESGKATDGQEENPERNDVQRFTVHETNPYL